MEGAVHPVTGRSRPYYRGTADRDGLMAKYPVGTVFKHHRRPGYFRLLGFSLRHSDSEVLVTYAPVHDIKSAESRDAAEFFGVVWKGGSVVDRFKEVPRGDDDDRD